jgi:glycosyltransferase involved in cell wall biosynthesis
MHPISNNSHDNYHICVLSSDTKHSIDRTIPLARYGYKISFIAREVYDTVDKLYSYQNIQVIFWKHILETQKISRLKILVNLLRELSPNLLIVHYCAYSYFHAAILSGIKPIIGILMGSDLMTKNIIPLHLKLELRFTLTYLRYIELLCAKTRQIQAKAKKQNILGKLLVIPWGVSLSSTTPIDLAQQNKLRQNLGFSTDDWILFAPRTMSSKERIVEIILGFAVLSHEIKKKARLLIVEHNANKHYRQKIIETIREKKLQKCIRIIPDIPKDKMPYYYQSCDALISNSAWDGMPQTVFEAALYQMPMILSNLPQYNDILENGKSVLLNNGTPDDIANIIARLIENKKLAKNLGYAAKKHVREKGDFEYWSSEFIRHINTIRSSGITIKIPKHMIIKGKLLIITIFILRKFPFNKINIMAKSHAQT